MHRRCVPGPLFGPGDEARYMLVKDDHHQNIIIMKINYSVTQYLSMTYSEIMHTWVARS